jgi:hypothetical protein
MFLSKNCWSRLRTGNNTVGLFRRSSPPLREFPSSLSVRTMSSLSAEDASSQSKNYITTFAKEYGSVIVAIGGFFGGCYTFYFLLKADIKGDIRAEVANLDKSITQQADRILGILAAKGDGQDKMIEGHGKMIEGHEKMIEGHGKMIESFDIKIESLPKASWWSGKGK